MRTIKIVIILGASVLLSCAFIFLPKPNTINFESKSLVKKDICTDLIDSLNEIIVDQKEQIHFLRDELQFRESEISYWGHKYDSIKQKK
jgi:site-specific DNA-adenine methylase